MSVFSEVSKAFSPDLPKDLGDMNEHLDYILPKIIPHGEDLRERHFWLSKRWKEVRQEEGFHEAILHIFNEGGEYILSVDGNLTKGSWKQLGEYNSLVIEMGIKSELFDIRFLNPDFLIMSKHGDQARKGLPKFFVLVHEPASKYKNQDLDWRNIMEKLFNVWRENSLSIWAWLFFVIVIGAIIYASK
ncbi:MAG: hypothetical protein JNJ57_10060 [Saprospiraceae bacterium]|nr:hypothetical protein [Saprospiraceae bacterium]